RRGSKGNGAIQLGRDDEATARCQRSSNQIASKIACQRDGGQHAMDNLPSWVSWIMTIAVVISQGIAFLSVRPLARLLRWLLWPRPEAVPKPEGERAHKEPTGVVAPRLEAELSGPGDMPPYLSSVDRGGYRRA